MAARPVDAPRLESMWAGAFGDAYVARNARLDRRRSVFWRGLLDRHTIRSVLEVGCGQGGNLRPISRVLAPDKIWGTDINAVALARARRIVPGANLTIGTARHLPYRDSLVDLAFTVGVLIHQPETTLPLVMAEVVRCSRRFILWAEYHAPRTEEIAYRGQRGALYRRDYAGIYAAYFPDLVPVDEGYLGPGDGFDRLTWQLLSKFPENRRNSE